jgi:hypothetical protein
MSRVVVESYRGAVPITPDDDTVFAPTRGVYIGSGVIKVDMADGTTVTLTALNAGDIHPISVTKVYATDTTATDIVVFY